MIHALGPFFSDANLDSFPIVSPKFSNNEGMVATIRHNGARGRHQMAEISEVVKTLSPTVGPRKELWTNWVWTAEKNESNNHSPMFNLMIIN
ncbi:hypothetical protein WIW50_18680 [Flavobacteriaceae bacterium 3-367]